MLIEALVVIKKIGINLIVQEQESNGYTCVCVHASVCVHACMCVGK